METIPLLTYWTKPHSLSSELPEGRAHSKAQWPKYVLFHFYLGQSSISGIGGMVMEDPEDKDSA